MIRSGNSLDRNRTHCPGFLHFPDTVQVKIARSRRKGIRCVSGTVTGVLPVVPPEEEGIITCKCAAIGQVSRGEPSGLIAQIQGNHCACTDRTGLFLKQIGSIIPADTGHSVVIGLILGIGGTRPNGGTVRICIIKVYRRTRRIIVQRGRPAYSEIRIYFLAFDCSQVAAINRHLSDRSVPYFNSFVGADLELIGGRRAVGERGFPDLHIRFVKDFSVEYHIQAGITGSVGGIVGHIPFPAPDMELARYGICRVVSANG